MRRSRNRDARRSQELSVIDSVAEPGYLFVWVLGAQRLFGETVDLFEVRIARGEAIEPCLGREEASSALDKEMRTWIPHELRTFLESAAVDRLYAAWLLLSTTGMRRGEVLGLRWMDLDLDKGSLSVRQTLITTHYRIEFSTPKTKRGRRQIALDAQTVTALRTHRKQQLEEKMMVGPGYTDSDLVFTRADGGPIHPDYFSQSFDRMVPKLGLSRIRLHDLRHTYATVALQAGVPVKVVSERLGHSSIAITLDIYSHVMPGMDEDAAERVATLIFKS